MFSLVLLLKSKFFTCVALVSHSCRTGVVRVALMSHSCRSWLAFVLQNRLDVNVITE